MDRLNYHHLRYFREVATQGHLGHAAERLNVSQSALSVQIRQLEDRLGHALFDRVGRRLVLTEAGRIALDHADRIFSAGEDLLATLRQNQDVSHPLRVGAQSTLVAELSVAVLAPTFGRARVPGHFAIRRHQDLLSELEALSLDVVLTTEVPKSANDTAFAAQKIAEQPVGLHGHPERLRRDSLADLLTHEPVILPTENVIRAGFENLIAKLGIQPNVVAQVDDMAMVRLLARENVGLAVSPAVVLADEIASGRVASAPYDLEISEPFFAVTLPRKFPHAALKTVLSQ